MQSHELRIFSSATVTPKIEVLREARFVDNGKVITTAGISAGIDGALHMVAKFQGLAQAKRVAYIMEYDSWVPGNGVLSGDNPYLNTRTEEDLVEYLGSYQFQNGSNLITLNMSANRCSFKKVSMAGAKALAPVFRRSGPLLIKIYERP